MKLNLLVLAFFISLANSQNCQNGGFSIIRGRDIVNGAFIDRVLINEYFCHEQNFMVQIVILLVHLIITVLLIQWSV